MNALPTTLPIRTECPPGACVCDRDALLQSMEREFTRSAFLMQAEATGIKPGTASTWLKRLVKHGMIESVDGKGTYRKPLPNGM